MAEVCSCAVCRIAYRIRAYEIFNYDQTLALLPLADNCSSVVLTLSTPEIEKLVNLDREAFIYDILRRLNNRLGDVSLVSDRFSYPLVTTFAKQFIVHRFALIGDAAVGMHPVTAHGFNLGLLGAETLTKQLSKSEDLGNASALARYERIHKKATLPLFLSTIVITKLYADDRVSARLIRSIGLRMANRFNPLKSSIVNRLMHV